MLLEIRAGLVLVPLEVTEANRSHFHSDHGDVGERPLNQPKKF
jgi:hypothetical protein